MIHSKELRKLITLVLAIKLCVIIAIAVAHYTIPFCTLCYESNYLVDSTLFPSLTSSYQTWDVQHYITIAQNGYSADHISNAFFPLYPSLIALVDMLIPGPTLIAAWVVSTLISTAAFVAVFLFVARLRDVQTAWKTTLLLLAFPTAFYFHLPYSEGVFLLVSTLLLYGMYFGKHTVSWFSALLLPLSRPQGLLLLPVTIAHTWETYLHTKKIPWKNTIYTLLATSIGVCTYFVILYFSAGDALAGFHAQTQYFASKNSVNTIWHPIEWFRMNFITVEWTFHRVNTSVINRVFFVGFIALLVAIWKRLDKTLFAFALLVGLLPALTGDLVSFPRYMVMVLPIFIALALIIKRQDVFITVLAHGAIIQLFMLVLHSQNYFVA